MTMTGMCEFEYIITRRQTARKYIVSDTRIGLNFRDGRFGRLMDYSNRNFLGNIAGDFDRNQASYFYLTGHFDRTRQLSIIS